MTHNWMKIAFTGLLVLTLAVGCSQPYRITHNLETPIDFAVACSIGDIGDELPLDTEADNKPTVEQIEKLRGYLEKELSEEDFFKIVGLTGSGIAASHSYEVTGGIVEYKRGSGFVRFLIGFGAGNAKLTARLSLVDLTTNQTVFEGYFKRVVSSGYESGDKTLERIAQDFAKALKKEMKRLAENG